MANAGDATYHRKSGFLDHLGVAAFFLARPSLLILLLRHLQIQRVREGMRSNLVAQSQSRAPCSWGLNPLLQRTLHGRRKREETNLIVGQHTVYREPNRLPGCCNDKAQSSRPCGVDTVFTF